MPDESVEETAEETEVVDTPEVAEETAEEPEVAIAPEVVESLPESVEEIEVALSTQTAAVTESAPENAEVKVVTDSVGDDEVIGRKVNFDVRTNNPWPRGAVRAGLEGMQCVGYGSTHAEALESLKIAAGVG